MPTKYEYDHDLNIVHCRPSGDLSILEIANYFKEITNDDVTKAGFIELVHLRNVENFLFSSKEAGDLLPLYREFKDKTRIKGTIFIGEEDMCFGIARMMQNLFESSGLKNTIFVARNEKEAKKIIDNMNG